MKKMKLLLATGIIAIASACSKKSDSPQPAAQNASASTAQYRLEEDGDASFVTASVETSANGSRFVIIKYNPAFVKPIPGYATFTIKPIVSYPAYSASFADAGISENCYNESLDVLNKAQAYMGANDLNAMCDILDELEDVANECPQAKPAAEGLLSMSKALGCK